jgi:hypothetical protein
MKNKELLEEAADKSAIEQFEAGNSAYILGFINGAKWQAERMYSKEDVRNAYRWGTTVNHGTKEHFNELIEQFKKK